MVMAGQGRAAVCYDCIQVLGQLVEDEAHQPWWHKWYMEENLAPICEPGVEGAAFLLGVAAAQGVEVTIPGNSTLLDHDLPSFYYGYRDDLSLQV